MRVHLTTIKHVFLVLGFVGGFSPGFAQNGPVNCEYISQNHFTSVVGERIRITLNYTVAMDSLQYLSACVRGVGALEEADKACTTIVHENPSRPVDVYIIFDIQPSSPRAIAQNPRRAFLSGRCNTDKAFIPQGDSLGDSP